MKNNYAFCITHNSPLIADLPVPTWFCVAVYAPIPELDMSDEWVDSLVPPTPKELQMPDFYARELEADFIGE